jgi:hypothetical protein
MVYPFILRYHGRMKTEPARSPEFAKFDALVGRVLSVPKSEIQKRIADEKRTAKTRPKKSLK